MDLLTLDTVTLSRGEVTLISELSLSVAAGELLWLRGANGVGKTSLLRLMAGLLRPDSGSVTYKDAMSAGNVIALQSHTDALKPDFTVHENIAFWAKVANRSRLTHEALTRLDLAALADRPARTLSAGQSRRAALAQLWISGKALWIMDEPSAAMDLSGSAIIDALLTDHLANGGAAIIASHAEPRALSAKARQIVLNPSEAP